MRASERENVSRPHSTTDTDTGNVLRVSDLFAASGILTIGSFLLLVSSLSFSLGGWPAVLRFPAVFLHFLGCVALAGLLLEFEGRRPEKPAIFRKKALMLGSIAIAFLVGIVLLALLYPASTTRLPAWPFMVVSFLFPFIPAVWAPVVLVHAAIFWWNTRALPGLEQRVIVGVGAFLLFGIVGFGLGGQLLEPELLFWLLLPVAGFTVVGYSLVALGNGLAFREIKLASRGS